MRRRAWFAIAVSLIACMAVFAAAVDQCSVCGAQVDPSARHFRTQDGHETYCEKCFVTAPRCPRCKLPTPAGAIDPESGLCSRCIARLPRCTACQRVITDAVYTFKFAPGQFCGDCKRTRPACHVCGVPVGKDHWRFPDGRNVCAACGERAVVDVDEIRSIMRDTELTIRRRLGLAVKTPFEVRVEKLADFRASPDTSRGGDGAFRQLYGKELGAFRRSAGRTEIILLFGLPPELIYETAAHEYAHAWADENCRADLTPELQEGFAQWVAADVLRSKGFRGALEKLEARSDVPYGSGYRRIRSMQRERLWATILRNE
jgi:hypothetical protein